MHLALGSVVQSACGSELCAAQQESWDRQLLRPAGRVANVGNSSKSRQQLASSSAEAKEKVKPG